MPCGVAGEDLVDTLAETAAAHIVDVVDRVAHGEAGVTQDEAAATRAPRPVAGDFVVDGALSARRIFHFVRGVGRWNTLVVPGAGENLRALDAIDFDNSTALPGEHALVGDVLHLGCVDGVVRLNVRPL